MTTGEPADKSDSESFTIPVIEERAVLLSKPGEKGTVFLRKVVHEREAYVETVLRADDVLVERKVLDAAVPAEAPPPVRYEGDVLVIPILEERLVIEKRLFVREELRVRRVERARIAQEQVTLRREEVQIDREQVTRHSVREDKSCPDGPEEHEMDKMLIGVFDSRNQAETACQELRACGLPEDRITVRAGTREEASPATSATGDEEDHVGFFGRIFSWLEGNESPSPVYAEAVRRGGCVVVVDGVSDDRVDEAVRVLEQNGAVDINERTSTWRAEGWTGAASSGTPAPSQMQAKGEPRSQMGARSTTIPVVEEQLQVGKREVQRGGVRVYTRTTERPVQQDVTLREERARVERHPVDRPATEAELGQAFEEKTVELRETAEEPVVAKTARVVEEVEVSKEVAQRTEKVQDTVRRTDVDVEELAARQRSVADPANATAAPRSSSANVGGQRAAMNVDDLNRLLRDELSAIETYRQALDKNRDEYEQDARFQRLAQMLHHHEQAAMQLRNMIRQIGGTESNDSGAWGTWANTVMGTAKLFGDKSALKALKEGEESGIKDYRSMLEDRDVAPEAKNLFTSILAQEQQHVVVLDQLIEAA